MIALPIAAQDLGPLHFITLTWTSIVLEVNMICLWNTNAPPTGDDKVQTACFIRKGQDQRPLCHMKGLQ